MPPRPTFLLLCISALVLFRVPADSLAQHAQSERRHVLEAADYEAGTSIAPVAHAGKNGAASAIFEVTYVDFPDPARAAFDYALGIWGMHVASSVPITVEARWVELGTNVLGSAGPSTLVSPQEAPYSETWYPPALAAALTGETMLKDGQYDIVASFSSTMDWYFGIDAAPPSGTYDFITVVLHEIGHGIGLIGSFRIEDGDEETGTGCDQAAVGEGCWGYAAFPRKTLPVIYDHFVSDLYGASLIDTGQYPNPSLLLASAYESGALFFDGPESRIAYQDLPIDLFSPSTYKPASSIAHLDEETFSAGDPNSLMTPHLARSEAIHSPGSLFCAMLEDMGWPLGDACVYLLEQPYADGDTNTGIDGDYGDNGASGPARADLPASAPDGLVIHGLFPNPAVSNVTIRVSSAVAQQVTLAVYDVMGREVGRAKTVPLPTNTTTRIDVSVANLSPGLYVARTTGLTGSATRTLVVGR